MMCLVYILAADEEEAEKITTHLLEKRLIACVNSTPVKSRYWWKEKIETDTEVALIAKSKEELAEKIIEEVRKIHSYEVPIVDIIPINKSYKEVYDWLESETTSDEQ